MSLLTLLTQWFPNLFELLPKWR